MSRPLEIQMPSVAKQYAPVVKEPALQAVDIPAITPRVPTRAKPEVAEKLPARELFLMSAKTHSLAALMTFLSIGALVAFWYVATLYKLDFYVRFNNIPTPGEVFTNMVELMQNQRFQTNIWKSVVRIMQGFAMATALGVTLGLLCGRFTVVRGLMFPALEVLRPIPAIAWVPISIMLWPTTESSIIFITFIGAFFPILINTMAGVKGVDPVLLRAAKSLGANEFTMLTKVILPAALPNVFTGLAVGMGVAWVSLIAAEMISGQFGVGYFTWEAYSLIEYPNIVLGMIVIGVLGLLCSGGIVLLARLLMPWQHIAGPGGGK
ncbi:ABC transporter permease [Limnobacter sp.]|uniref:ABC transporter permease n=1 Tax=Limnobacter sp. TaxID=2003368 RepID=UPI002FE3906C